MGEYIGFIHFSHRVTRCISVGLHQRHRLQLHAGSDVEILDRLSDYGITATSVPSIFGGGWRPSDFIKWRDSRYKKELSRMQAPP